VASSRFDCLPGGFPLRGFQDFIAERKYLHNASPRTIEWHENSFRWLPSETPTQEQLNSAVIQMLEKGLKATSCNAAIRAVNAYLKWTGSPHKLRKLERALAHLAHAHRATNQAPCSTEARGRYQRRLHRLVLLCWTRAAASPRRLLCTSQRLT